MSASERPTSLRCVLTGVCGGQKKSNFKCSSSSRGPNVGLNTTKRDNFWCCGVRREQRAAKKKKKKKKKVTIDSSQRTTMSHHGEQEMDDDNDATNTAASTVDANDNFAEPTLPSQTLYLSNLNEKIKIPGAFKIVSCCLLTGFGFAELKKSLYELCSAFGPVLDVVASKVTQNNWSIAFED
jgi:hypothetical protein